jgi:hypothetical protein
MLPGGIRRNLLVLVLAAVAPFLALIGLGLWSQRQDTEAAAKERAINHARVLAAQVDDHIGNLEHLLTGLSRAGSADPADVSANDSLLRKVKAELPDFVSGISLFSLNGDNIGTSWQGGGRGNIKDRLHFREVLAGHPLSIGEVHVGRMSREWVVNIARRVEDHDGRLRGVLVGTGYASLSYLTRLPLSRIKIDRSFVLKIGDNAQDAAIVRSLVAMAHNLGLVVVAEGVETEAQAAFLRNESCEEAQGFLYAAPLSASDFERHLRTRSVAQKSSAGEPRVRAR